MVVAIAEVPFAILALTIVPVAPPESVIVVGYGLAAVASAKKSIPLSPIISSPVFVLSESVPLSSTLPSAVSIS